MRKNVQTPDNCIPGSTEEISCGSTTWSHYPQTPNVSSALPQSFKGYISSDPLDHGPYKGSLEKPSQPKAQE